MSHNEDIQLSVPGKVMLLGEHAVVYGYHCLVAAVDWYLTATIGEAAGQDQISTPGVTDQRFLLRALALFRESYQPTGHVRIAVGSQLGTYGLGSSAAVTVAIVGACARFYGVELSREEAFSLAYRAIVDIQSVASGFDAAVSIWGGTILFSGKTKQVESLGNDSLPLVVAYSGKKVGTVSLVQQVADQREKFPGETDHLFLEMERITQKGRQLLLEHDWPGFGALCSQQQRLLVQLGVSTPQLDRLVTAAVDAGAYGAKLSGAGGGDCMIAVVAEEKRQDVETALRQAGGEVLRLSVGTGVGIV